MGEDKDPYDTFRDQTVVAIDQCCAQAIFNYFHGTDIRAQGMEDTADLLDDLVAGLAIVSPHDQARTMARFRESET